MSVFPIKPSHKPIKTYFEALALFHKHGHVTEGNTRSAFADLLKKCCPTYGWHLVEEYQFKGTGKQPLRADGALVDDLTLVHGLWEAKDSDDDLPREIKSKRDKGYPLTNILFQSPGYAVLYQHSRIAFDGPITDADKLLDVLQLFFEHRQAHEVDWEDAVTKFAEKIPDLANGVTDILAKEYEKNQVFRENFQSFAALCRESINPDLSDESVRKMLVQHLLTERIFRRVFNNQEFLQRNVIAVEIEKVIRSITARHFSRDEFLKPLDRFYSAIEKAAESQSGYTEKQHFLNAVYERFFQSFDARQADTHGIVYTPQPIVEFIVSSVEEILKQEFGKSLSDSGVHILDPFTGTGNFITRIMQQIKRSALPRKYAEELHCNEIMLLPYYIASMNIEHAYMERAGEYKPFEGICLVDTFELSESKQIGLFAAENTARVQRQKNAPIRVILGNPPYNLSQLSENDNNRNRRYGALDSRIAATYAADSTASTASRLGDAYVKAIRWASDRLGDDGIVAFVSNGSFIDQISHDGMRKHLMRDFDKLYVLNLAGNVRKFPQFSGNTHNVFGIQVAVSIEFLIRNRATTKSKELLYASARPEWTKGKKLSFLTDAGTINGISWDRLTPDARGSWLTSGLDPEYSGLIPIGSKEAKAGDSIEVVFSSYSLGSNTNRDSWAYNFQIDALEENIQRLITTYDSEFTRWHSQPGKKNADTFLTNDERKIKWSSTLKQALAGGAALKYSSANVRKSLYRPFCFEWQYFGKGVTHRQGQWKRFMPTPESENVAICATGIGAERPFATMATTYIPDLNFFGPGTVPMWFAFYVYTEDGTDRQENITDWALKQFQIHYQDESITKWDIFHAIYAILHHPEYRIRYAADLRREMPRIPFPPHFSSFVAAGKQLIKIHTSYETQPEYRLEEIEDEDAEVSFRLERMKLSKDKTSIRYNDFLTLRGIPAAAFEYRLGNRSALEWIIDQYEVSTDRRSEIVNDPNRAADPNYVLKLIRQVITVSLETNALVGSLPTLGDS